MPEIGMRNATGLLLLVLILGGRATTAQTGSARDSIVTVRGLLQVIDGPGGRPASALLTLEKPVQLGDRGTGILALDGDLSRLAQSDSHFLQVTGSVRMPASGAGAAAGGEPLPELHVTKVREAQAAGLVHHNLSRDLNEMVLVGLTVVPAEVHWRDAAGRLSPATPAVLFTITNMSRVELQPLLPTTDLVCVSVTPPGGNAPAWRYAWQASEASTRLAIKIGATFRSVIPLPEEAAKLPGRHTVRVTLCGLDEYAVEAPLVVAEH
jgi:hypothetical protein